MRKSSDSDALFPGTRRGILASTFMEPDRWWYLSDLAKHLGVSPSSLQRELAALAGAGVLRRRRDGNRVYFQPNPACPFFAELQGIMTKTAGLVDVLRESLRPLAASIDWAFVYGSFARSEEHASSDVDVMIIGQPGLADVAPRLRKAEQRLNRAVNPTVHTRKEFAKKVKGGRQFTRIVLDGNKLFIYGNARDLAEAIDRAEG